MLTVVGSNLLYPSSGYPSTKLRRDVQLISADFDCEKGLAVLCSYIQATPVRIAEQLRTAGAGVGIGLGFAAKLGSG